VDRDEIQESKRSSQYANNAEVSDADSPLLMSATGREDSQGAEPGSLAQVDVTKPVGAEPRSALTGRHQPGMGANETIDGLSGTEESARAAAEDEAVEDEAEDLPVADRAVAAPKII
jgi:hypothetical protein